ncbi:MarR family transcriptional regulator [Chelativorans sp. AA-79]|uniref:MarR family winged helix-turn-helix transcriptional regulator n=1 Tax=Chelativorans sp. AA-79 TaxID=3028735 RepID=UPI0023F9A83B|nr:MarR family transcriptional regulator [Chelativorans sp. AA-79]WEX10881.1 MarR family transcriptional regulator [Chelativorans sp. AA-79]
MSDLADMPGHMIRRFQQIAVAVFQSELGAVGSDLTPVQYAALRTIDERPGLDQASLAALIAYDRATIGGVVERLVSKGLIAREVSARDRRARVLTIAPKGRDLLDAVEPSVQRAQAAMLDGLDEAEAVEFMRLLRKAVEAGNESSRAPLRRPERD